MLVIMSLSFPMLEYKCSPVRGTLFPSAALTRLSVSLTMLQLPTHMAFSSLALALATNEPRNNREEKGIERERQPKDT